MVDLRMQDPPRVTNAIDLAALHSALEKVYVVSAQLDYPFSFDEVAGYFIPRLNITGQQLRNLFAGGRFSDIPFRNLDGYLLTSPGQSPASRRDRERVSAAKLDSASKFARVLRRLVPFIRTIAVTGSIAYGSAGRSDDIDLFLVTDSNRLWLSAFMALLLVRLYKLLRLRPYYLLPFCLSYLHDKQGFERESLKNQTNPLFARELLKAKPVAGIDQYREILRENGWVREIYTASYASKMRELEQNLDKERYGRAEISNKRSLFFDLAERITFIFLSRYLRLRAHLTNLRLKSEGQDLRVFEPILTPASCVYTSNFYRWLLGLWNR